MLLVGYHLQKMEGCGSSLLLHRDAVGSHSSCLKVVMGLKVSVLKVLVLKVLGMMVLGLKV